MPTSACPARNAIPFGRMADALGRLAVSTLAYALAVAVVAGIVLPTVLTPLPVAALLPEPPPVVARTPAAQLVEAAP